MEKKAQLGFDTVKAFIIGGLILGVLAIACVLALTTIVDTVGKTTTYSGVVINESMTFKIVPGNDTSVSSLKDIALTGVTLYNSTGVININSNNYTVSGGTIIAKNTSVYGNQTVKVSYSYTFTGQSDVGSVSGNNTKGIGQFFQNIPTAFVLLGVMVLILIISIVITYVMKFAGGQAVL